MKKTVFILATILYQLNCFSQAPSTQWKIAIGGSGYDDAYSIKQTSDGGYIIAGSTGSNDGDVTYNQGGSDVWIVKISAIGLIQWQKTFGGTGIDYANCIQLTADGGYIIAGSTESNDGDVTSNHGSYDVWIVKISSTGTIQWQKALGGTGIEDSYSIQQTTDGGYIVAGTTNSIDGDIIANHGGNDFWIIKLNNFGAIQWQKTFGGTKEDLCFSIQQTTDLGYIVAGQTNSINGDIKANHGDYDGWILKLNDVGTIQWQKCLGGTGQDSVSSIQQAIYGGYIVAGYNESRAGGDVTIHYGSEDFWIVKLDDIGTKIWDYSFKNDLRDIAVSIQQTTDGGYIAAGYITFFDALGSLPNGFILKLDSTGYLVWNKAIGGTGIDYINSIQQTADDDYIVAGYSNSTDGSLVGNHGDYDGWIVKLSFDSLTTNDFNKIGFTISPNPTESILNLKFSNNTIIDKVIITDLIGKEVLQQSLTSNQVNVQNLAKGMYIIQAYSGNEKFTSKFIKE